MSVAVRRATIEDADAIAAVHVASWEGAYRGLVPDVWFDQRTLERRRAMWRELLRAPTAGALILVTERERVIIGLCSANLPGRDVDADEDTAEISALYVEPDHWGSGAGRALMDAVLAQLTTRGAEVATLWVLEANARGRAFYAAAGFMADGARQHRRGGPAEIRLRRDLHLPA